MNEKNSTTKGPEFHIIIIIIIIIINENWS